MSKRPSLRPWIVLLACVLGGCCRPCRPLPAPPPTASALTSARTSTEGLTAEQRVAVGWIRRAHAAESAVTRRLRRIAEREGATLAGLEHRFKTLASTVSKLERLRAKSPESALEDIEVYDALRYTMVAPDDPPGHHDAVIRGALEDFERAGYEVRRVKNYWPRGDSYSGTNCTLATATGFPWELQFHTPASYAAKSSVHGDYDRMRDPETPAEERMRLFEKMTALWEDVPIPAGILVPASLHANEEIRLLPAP